MLAPVLPMLLAARLRCAAEEKAYLRLVELSERLGLRVYSLARERVSFGQQELFRHAFELHLGEKSLDDVVAAVIELIQRECDDKLFRRKFKEPGRNWYNWKALRYFLYEYEESLWNKGRPKVTWDEVAKLKLNESIEHILPQTPEQGTYAEFSIKEKRRLLGDLGNLCLTMDNSRLGRKEFDAKREIYKDSDLKSERRLALCRKWSPADLRRRRRLLVEWALGRWSLKHLGKQSGLVAGEEE